MGKRPELGDVTAPSLMPWKTPRATGKCRRTMRLVRGQVSP
jgi:hypothetical protein